MTRELFPSCSQILWPERHADGEQRRRHPIHGRLGGRSSAQTFGGQRCVQQVNVRVPVIALDYLTCDIADESMIRMSSPTFRSEGDYYRRLHRVDDRGERGSEFAERFERGETAVWQADQMEFADAESVGRARRLLRARGG